MTQVTEHALTINVDGSHDSHVEIVFDTPVIEFKGADMFLTMTVSMTREFNQTPNGQTDIECQDWWKSNSEAHLKNDAELYPMPSLFRLLYLCEQDGTEWSRIEKDPFSKSYCPKCERLSSAIAILALPEEAAPNSAKTVSKFKLCRKVGAFHQN